MAAPDTADHFIADVHLGKLARLMRLSGFDTAYRPGFKKEDILRIALKEKRFVLTRDQLLLKRAGEGFLVRSDDPEEQCRAILVAGSLIDRMAPFSRCLECNGEIIQIDKSAVSGAVPPAVIEWLDTFFQCTGCRKIYWRGTHYEHLKELADRLRQATAVALP